MKLYTTGEFISNDNSFEKKNLTTKMKLYTISKFVNNVTLFEKKILLQK